mmetsp:Transcript_8917/g.13301  ORF Transcript_8917/g.13301 Transcript_8917/m.13301 type:complete len:93 (-) Transcript_8917:62-340(-)
MECSQLEIEGKAMLLDIPLDKLKDFISKFNSEIRSRFRRHHSHQVTYEADVNDITRESGVLSLKWSVAEENSTSKGEAKYHLDSSALFINYF